MEFSVDIIGAGLAGSEAALQLAERGVRVRLFEMRPHHQTAVHETGMYAELVCSNSLKSMKPESAAGMLKAELEALGSHLYAQALNCRVPAGGALAVDRETFSEGITRSIDRHPLISVIREEVVTLPQGSDAVIVATGPLTSEAFAQRLSVLTGEDHLAFYDAAAPIVMSDSLDHDKLFKQGRYEDEGTGDYLNAPFSKDAYESFIEELLAAERVILKDFEIRELFQACQPIEEIARKGRDAPRFGALKPVGLNDPQTGRRPWAAVQLRAENAEATSYNLVGFQTNLTFREQQRIFRMIPGFEHAEFARYGVMHRNTFIDAPRLLDRNLRLKKSKEKIPVFFAGQIAGTEGYCEAIMSGLMASLGVYSQLKGFILPLLPRETAFGALLFYATDPLSIDYQPMHVNFGILPPLETPFKNKKERYAAYSKRGRELLLQYSKQLDHLIGEDK